MNKIHYQTDQVELTALAGGELWKLYEDKHIKSAASDAFTKDMLRQHAPDKDHFMMHLIAMGAMEKYSSNRNGDAFPRDMLKKSHTTFVTNGHLYREHRNRCPETQGIGTIKASAYNDKMDRVELIVHANREKAAAEYEKAKNGEPLSYSMSIRVPYDTCNCCEKKASRPADYCDHLKYNMNRYIPEMQKYAFAINPEGTFFDISVVEKPADKIARYLEYAFENGLNKAASENDIITGAQWAEFEQVNLPEYTQEWSADVSTLIEKLASAEEVLEKTYAGHIKSASDKDAFIHDVVPIAFTEELTDEELNTFRALQPETFFGELTKRSSILPFDSFVAYVTGRSVKEVSEDPLTKYSREYLPNIYRELKRKSSEHELFNVFKSATCCDGCSNSDNTDAVQNLMDMAERKFSIKAEPVSKRVIYIVSMKCASELAKHEKSCISLPMAKQAAAKALSESYAVYKLAALQTIQTAARELIDEPQLLLVAGQNF